MVKILINGKQIKDTKPIEIITGIHVIAVGLPQVVSRREAQAIADYTFDACQRCIGTIMFNQTIIRKEDVKKVIL